MNGDNFTQVPKFDTDVSYDEWRLQFMFLTKFSNCKKVIELYEQPNNIKED